MIPENGGLVNRLRKFFRAAGIPEHRQRSPLVATDVFFQPHHMVPPPEFLAALVELPHKAVAQLLVKPDAVLCEIGVVVRHGAGDAGVHAEEAAAL